MWSVLSNVFIFSTINTLNKVSCFLNSFSVMLPLTNHPLVIKKVKDTFYKCKNYITEEKLKSLKILEKLKNICKYSGSIKYGTDEETFTQNAIANLRHFEHLQLLVKLFFRGAVHKATKIFISVLYAKYFA